MSRSPALPPRCAPRHAPRSLTQHAPQNVPSRLSRLFPWVVLILGVSIFPNPCVTSAVNEEKINEEELQRLRNSRSLEADEPGKVFQMNEAIDMDGGGEEQQKSPAIAKVIEYLESLRRTPNKDWTAAMAPSVFKEARSLDVATGPIAAADKRYDAPCTRCDGDVKPVAKRGRYQAMCFNARTRRPFVCWKSY